MTTAAFWLAGYEAICHDSWQLSRKNQQQKNVSVNAAFVTQIDSNKSRRGGAAAAGGGGGGGGGGGAGGCWVL